MERMKLLQESQLEEEGVTQEEMATRFELEKTESLLVAPSGEEGQGCRWLGMGSPRAGGITGEEGRSRIGPPAAPPPLCPVSRSTHCLVDLSDHSLQSNVLCFVEDPEFGYKDFTRRGEQAPPTFRAQVGARGPKPTRGDRVTGRWVTGPACLSAGTAWGVPSIVDSVGAESKGLGVAVQPVANSFEGQHFGGDPSLHPRI